ncbi:2762_t:CDS:2 [Cetraspora pellucida]|uniref:2762_t:CDS:1 n=1 Tax=Cetraspora pellucida TaxID=1433469 RepID=A0A9N9JB32_9GLOM|nr:2762_t:CDS:2 [Cetraspora pellucida]
MPNYVITTKAYLKIILHACKHPFTSVNGILLAEEEASDDNNSDVKIIIVDVVPLFHHWVTLTPMLEVGLQQVSIYANRNKLKMAGYYHANERADENKLPPFGQKIASKIQDNFHNSIALVVQNTKLSPENPEIAIVPYIFKDNQWRPDNKAFSDPQSPFTLENQNIPSITSQSIFKRDFEVIYDFDEHLENVELDWLANVKVIELALENKKRA